MCCIVARGRVVCSLFGVAVVMLFAAAACAGSADDDGSGGVQRVKNVGGDEKPERRRITIRSRRPTPDTPAGSDADGDADDNKDAPRTGPFGPDEPVVFCWDWLPEFERQRGLVPMVWMRASHDPDEFGARAARVHAEYGRLAIHVWHPGGEWFDMDHNALYADVDTGRDRARPYILALQKRGLTPELWVFDYEESPLWRGGTWRRDPEPVETANRWLEAAGDDRRIDFEQLKRLSIYRPETLDDYELAFEVWQDWVTGVFRAVWLHPAEDLLGSAPAVNWAWAEDSDDKNFNGWPIADVTLTKGLNNPWIYREPAIAQRGRYRGKGFSSPAEAREDFLRRIIVPDDTSAFEIIPWIRADRPDWLRRALRIAGEHDVHLDRVLLWNAKGIDTDQDWSKMSDPMRRGTLEVARILNEHASAPAD